MNLAEVVAASITCWLAVITVVAYGMDAIGLTISPWVVLAGSLVTTGGIAAFFRLKPEATATFAPSHLRPLIPWLGIVGFVFSWLLRLAWPALLPPGQGPDLTHHLLLIDYLERHWRLAHDPALGAVMGEMAHYTPGAHLLAVLFGKWTGTDGFRAVYSVVAFTAAMTAGFVFLIVVRICKSVPIALIAVFLMLLPRAYFVGAFAHDSYLAQVVSALFAVAMWWAVMVWDDEPSPAAAMLIGVMALGVFLAWPVWIGPPFLVFFAAFVLHRELAIGTRARHVAIAVVPVAILALVHAIGRWGWALIVRTSGAVLHPSIEAVGWAFPLLAIIGIAFSLTDRRARLTLIFVVAIITQAVTLYFMSQQISAQTPYMFYKMGYLALYPLATLGALGLGKVLKGLERFGKVLRGSDLAWLVATLLVVLIVRPLLAMPRPVPVVSRDFYDAGQWTRANLGSSCVDYLVADAYTAYWLHLAVLGNPRSSARTAEVDQHEARAAIARWIPAEGLPYAIADMTLLPDEIRARVTLLKQFGSAGVIARPGGSMKGCDFSQ